MKALIFASGKGTRMGELTGRLPKPLIDINGKPLISRIICNLEKAGITEVCITLGYQGEYIRRQLGNKQGSVHIDYIVNREWEKGNVFSLHCAKHYMDEPFLLCMGDHLSSVGLLEKLIATKSKKSVVVALDKKIQPTADDMKVLVENKISKFGKFIIGQYVDTGFFMCSPMVFDYATATIMDKNYELSDCMNLCADHNDIDFVDITGEFWLDIDTPDDLNNYYIASLTGVASRSTKT